MTAPSITMTRRQIHARIAELNPDNDDDLREIVKLHLDSINLQQMRDRRANRSRGTDGNQRAIAGEGNSAGRDGGKKDSMRRRIFELNPHNDMPWYPGASPNPGRNGEMDSVYAVASPNLEIEAITMANRSRGTDGKQLAIAGEGNSAGRDGGEMDSVVRGLDQILLGAGNHAGRDNKIVVTGNIFVLLKPDAGGGNHLPSPLIKGSTYTVAIKYDNV